MRSPRLCREAGFVVDLFKDYDPVAKAPIIGARPICRGRSKRRQEQSEKQNKCRARLTHFPRP